MEDRLDDAIHVLRNHAEPVAHSSRVVDTSLRLPTLHSSERLVSSANGLTFPASLTTVSVPACVISHYCVRACVRLVAFNGFVLYS